MTGERTFRQVLVNTLVANVTTSFLWFALTFWAYLETRSVLATGLIGGTYMLMLAVFAMYFGTLVDRHRKHHVMVLSAVITLAAFLVGGAIYAVAGGDRVSDVTGPWFWLFAGVILVGSVVESMRNIALSTTVTLLIPPERRANANGLVGTVQGLAFIVTSVFSGLAIGQLGMGWTLAVAIGLTAVSLGHLLTIRIDEPPPQFDETNAPRVDVRGALAAIALAPGLLALIFFTTFNNLLGGVYLALMDPYGLELFTVEQWGLAFGVASTGFIVGGAVVAKRGLGANPIRTMLILLAIMGLLGAVFALRDWWWLYLGGIWLYMALFPPVEAAEQTVIQRVVDYQNQGRVFGFAQAVESASMPITAFLIAPVAQFWIIPAVDSPDGERRWGWLLGSGDARGIALIFLIAGLLLTVAALAAFGTRSYRRLSAAYAAAPG